MAFLMQFHRQCYYKTWIKSNHNIEHADKLDTTVYGDVKKNIDVLDKSPTIKINLYRKYSTPNIKMPHVDIVCIFVHCLPWAFVLSAVYKLYIWLYLKVYFD